MSKTIIEVEEMLGKRGYYEVVHRLKDGTIKKIYKITAEQLNQSGETRAFNVINSLASQKKETLKVINSVKKQLNSIAGDSKSILNGVNQVIGDISCLKDVMKNVELLQSVNIGFTAANLATTVVGFMIMNQKLDKISSDIKDMKEMIKKIGLKQQLDISREIDEVIADYNEMIDCDKRKQELTEKQYYELTRKLHGCIEYLYQVFAADAVFDRTKILNAIYTLLPMYSNVMRRYDTCYYYKNKSVISDNQKLHIDHDKWLKTFDHFTDSTFLEEFFDFWFIERKCGFEEVELASLAECSLVLDCKQLVENNLLIMECLEEKEQYDTFEDEIIEEATKTVNEKVEELDDEMIQLINPQVANISQQLRQMR